MVRAASLAFIALIGLGACNNAALEQRVVSLEEKVKTLEEKAAKAPAAAPGAAAQEKNPDEEAAMALYKEAAELSAQNKPDEAKAKLQDLIGKYPNTRAKSAADRLMAELSVVGKELAELKAEEWFQGNASLASNKATMLVFWEVWCPHCKREVPKLEETYNKFKGQGLSVVGMTSLSRGKTPDEVKAFITENKVSYPMAKASEDTWQFFGVNGVPAAAVVKGGKVVWRGHPASIKEEMIQQWLN